MTRVIEIPAHLDDRSFEQFAAGFDTWPPDEKLLFDARSAQWSSPYGLIGLLTAGQAIAEARRERPLFAVPASADVKSYWSRIGFFRYAADLFELHGKVPKAAASGPSDALLDVTPVRAMEDVHEAVNRISETAARILRAELGLSGRQLAGSVWRFRRLVRILLSTPAQVDGLRHKRIPFGAASADG